MDATSLKILPSASVLAIALPFLTGVRGWMRGTILFAAMTVGSVRVRAY